MDHLLSREEVGVGLLLICQGQIECQRSHAAHDVRRQQNKNSGGDALTGHTRSHPEHDG